MNLLADVPSRRLRVSVVAVNSAIAAGCLECHSFVHFLDVFVSFVHTPPDIFPMSIVDFSCTNPAQERLVLF